MKVLLVNKFHYLKGGSEKYYFSLAKALEKAGHEVIFFAMKDEKNESCNQEKYFVENVSKDAGFKGKIKFLLNINYSKEAYKKMKELLKDENPDLVILNLVHKQITCSIIDAIKEYNPKIKIVWTMHDLITVCPSYTMLDGKGNICEKCLHGDFKNCYKNKCIHGSKLMSYLSYYEAKFIKKNDYYNKVDLFVCPSDFYKKKLEEANFTKSKIVTLRNPLEIKELDSKSYVNGNYVLYFGRLSKEKGVLTLIKAMKDINYPLYIVGTGPIENELKQYVKENNLTNIKFWGYQTGDTLNNLVLGSKVVVLPSEWYENGPYSAMEAMAIGKPLIVSSLGGLPELVQDGKNGYIYNKDIELAEKIIKTIALNDDEYLKMSNASYLMAKQLFNADEYVEKLFKLLEE